MSGLGFRGVPLTLRRLRWLLLLPIPLVWCLVGHRGGMEFLESKLLDMRFWYRGPLPAPAKIVYVDVDARTLADIGSFPWNRKYFAEVAQVLTEYGKVKAIGMDFVFSDIGLPEAIDDKKMIEGNIALGRFLWKTPSVIVGANFGSGDFRDPMDRYKLKRRYLPVIAAPLPPVSEIEPPEVPLFNIGRSSPFSPPGVGLIDTMNAGTRWIPLFAPTNTGTFYHIALQLARVYYGLERDAIKVGDSEITLVRPDGSVACRIPLAQRQLLEVNWFSGWNGIGARKHISFVTILALAENIYAADSSAAARESARANMASLGLDNAIILIGPTDNLLQDLAVTSMDDRPVPKVSVHANAIQTIISGLYLQRPPPWVTDAVVFALSLVVAGLAIAGGTRSVLAKIMAVVALAAYTVAAFSLFKTQHVVLPLALPLASAFSTSFAALIWQVVEEQQQKGRIKGMFGTYLSPAVVNRMIESGRDPELGGHDAEITAYFSDIQAFSSFSEVMSSQKLGELLNEFLTACTDIVTAEGGSLDKYIGDAVVAMFGAPIELPDHAYRACLASQLVQAKISEMREKWKGEGDKWPTLVHELRTRIGLNSGVCMIGNMGSTTRFNYTMMGDNVNTAARMESGAKSWGVYTMVTESTRSACEQFGGDRVVFRPLGKIVVKGRTQAVPIHEIVGLKEHVTDRMRRCISLFSAALDRFYAREWDAALAGFKESEKWEEYQPGVTPGVKTNPSIVYQEIVEEFRASPPEKGWDGAYVMKEK